jgi:hypothetical protein
VENGYGNQQQQPVSNANQIAMDKTVLVRAARQLLSSVTRVLLLADRVLVTQILKAEDKVLNESFILFTTNTNLGCIFIIPS